jgi:hypothetical protein
LRDQRDYEIASIGGRPISSSDGAGSPERAFDDDSSTFWVSAERGHRVRDHAWIGYSFPQPEAIHRIRIEQPARSSYRQDVVRVEKSFDGGESWQTAPGGKFRLKGPVSEFSFEPGTPARLWRIVADGENANAAEDAWAVQTLAFFSRAGAVRQSPLTALSTTTAVPISGGDGSGAPERALDANPETFWISPERGSAVKDRAWIGVQFKEPEAIRQIHIEQTTNQPYRQDLVRLQKSVDDGETWEDTSPGLFRLTGAISEIDVAAGEPAKLWRLVAAADNATEEKDAWAVIDLKFFVAAETQKAQGTSSGPEQVPN